MALVKPVKKRSKMNISNELRRLIEMSTPANTNQQTIKVEVVVSGQIELVDKELSRPRFDPAPGSNVVPSSKAPVRLSCAGLAPAKWVRRMLFEDLANGSQNKPTSETA